MPHRLMLRGSEYFVKELPGLFSHYEQKERVRQLVSLPSQS